MVAVKWCFRRKEEISEMYAWTEFMLEETVVWIIIAWEIRICLCSNFCLSLCIGLFFLRWLITFLHWRLCREKIDIHIQLATKLLELIMGRLIRWKFLKALTGLNFWFVFKILCALMFFDFRFHILNVYNKLWVLLNSFCYILFLQISSDDGSSASGKTPDFAWEEFQKKGCPRMKIWHGKRLSSKMDGFEVEIDEIDSSVCNVPDDFLLYFMKVY